MRQYSTYILLCLLSFACNEKEREWAPPDNALFKRMPAKETGIAFENTLQVTENFDVFRYRNFYNGGGVGIGDVNNDGLADVFLVSNMGENKLYLNRGDWKFQDITATAGVKGSRIWSTGVSIADVNGDGLLDIYVCNAGDVNGKNQQNELFINNGNLTFTEKAREYGLADHGFSTHAAFFDYDKDGDLDCYVLNNSYRPISTLGYRNLRHVRDELGGHKLYRNDGNRFVDVSEQAGIYGSVIGFGLGITIGDVNQDNWPDMYVSNDFYERDYLYINNQDGTFREELEGHMGHISMFSMGADLADLNNDGYPEIFSTDMLPQTDERLKTLTAFETYDVYQLRLKNGYYHQFMRNMLHRNNGDGTFSEIGTMAGVEATDWSWGAVIADFDNDTNKDIYVCNGIFKDVTNQDFVEYLGSSEQMRAAIEGKKINFKEFVDRMPSVRLSNYLFTRDSGWHYKNVSADWGLDEPSFSNGAAYGDLDNDGDLDLVVNNVNHEAFVYRNYSREKKQNHYLALTFKGPQKNPFGVGAFIRAYVGGQVLSYDHLPIRGFQSSMDYQLIVGLGPHTAVDSLVVTWPDNRHNILTAVPADQRMEIRYSDASTGARVSSRKPLPDQLLQPIPLATAKHDENEFNEFDRDRLLYHMLSTQGPAFAVTDLNSDGRDDFFLGAALGGSPKIYIQKPDQSFQPVSIGSDDNVADDVAAAFFDADGDGDQDLYIVTGGTETPAQSVGQKDKLYLNEGVQGGVPLFRESPTAIPAIYQSGSCVKPADIDNDGDIDLFIGTRVNPLNYGIPCDQYILINDGKGTFQDATAAYAPGLRKLGMVTDATWSDIDGNGYPDLIVVGEWMPITIFSNDGRSLSRIDTTSAFQGSEGWWNRIHGADIDGDGDLDFVLGNLGSNSRFKPSPTNPVKLYVNDFDQNGSSEPIFTYSNSGNEYPMALRQDLLRQMSSLKKKFIFSKDYAGRRLDEVFDEDLLGNAVSLQFRHPLTSVLVNEGNFNFTLSALPEEAQVSPVYGIETMDINQDGHTDIVLGGNLFAVKPEIGRYDALHGLVLLGDGSGKFEPVSGGQSGLRIDGEVRYISRLRTSKGNVLAVVRNNDAVLFYKLNE